MQCGLVGDLGSGLRWLPREFLGLAYKCRYDLFRLRSFVKIRFFRLRAWRWHKKHRDWSPEFFYSRALSPRVKENYMNTQRNKETGG